MRFALIAWWLISYAALVHAETINLANGLSSIPLSNVLIAMSIAFVGGLAWTAHKQSMVLTESKNLWLIVSSDLLVSTVAGLATYFIASITTESPALQAVSILIAGYGGTRIMDGYVSVLIDWATGIFKRKSA